MNYFFFFFTKKIFTFVGIEHEEAHKREDDEDDSSDDEDQVSCDSFNGSNNEVAKFDSTKVIFYFMNHFFKMPTPICKHI